MRIVALRIQQLIRCVKLLCWFCYPKRKLPLHTLKRKFVMKAEMLLIDEQEGTGLVGDYPAAC